MSGPDSSIVQSIRHESEGWGFESPSGQDIFCFKNFDTFTRTPVGVSKMNAVARTLLTFQMLTLIQKYIPRLFCGPDCFTVSTLCTYSDLGSWGYFGVYHRSCDCLILVAVQLLGPLLLPLIALCLKVLYLWIDADMGRCRIPVSYKVLCGLHMWVLVSTTVLEGGPCMICMGPLCQWCCRFLLQLSAGRMCLYDEWHMVKFGTTNMTVTVKSKFLVWFANIFLKSCSLESHIMWIFEFRIWGSICCGFVVCCLGSLIFAPWWMCLFTCFVWCSNKANWLEI